MQTLSEMIFRERYQLMMVSQTRYQNAADAAKC